MARRNRHRWVRRWVAVPWSAAGGNLYTCLRCGLTRQSVPSGRGWKKEFGHPPRPGGKRRFSYGRTPPCPYTLTAPRPISRACRACGCTEERACPGGCYWIEDDLCSACARSQGYVPLAEVDWHLDQIYGAYSWTLGIDPNG